jgi:hypothetical protein
VILIQALELTSPTGAPSGRFRLVEISDEHDGANPLCDCGGRAHDNPTTAGHESIDAAMHCPVALAERDKRNGFTVPAAKSSVADPAVLSYGSDNAGGVHLCLGDVRIHLSGDAVHDLAAGLMAEASRLPSPAPGEPAR